MVNTDRGDYTVASRAKKDSFALTRRPNTRGSTAPSTAGDDGKIHADEEKPADAKSPVVK